jgi:hypothetical protein
MRRFLEIIPIIGVFVGTLVLVLAAVELGYRWARHRQANQELEKEAPVAAMVAATLGLLAFLLTFTFGIALDAYHARKLALVEEANAIRMTYRACDLIPQALRAETRGVLRQYVDERLRWANGQADQPGASANELLDRLWTAAGVAGAKNPGSVDVFLTYVGQVIELRSERLDVREQSKIPLAYWVILFIIAFLAFSGVGYHGGVAGTRRSPVMLAVALAFSAVIMVIVDMDSPEEGFIDVSQAPMVHLRTELARSNP